MLNTEQEEQPQEQSTDKKNAHYVDNKKFLEALIEYRKQIDYAKENGLPKPLVSNYIGECFLKIATHLSYKANFINYTFKDDMISDGIENCLTAVDKFDPTKSANPFAYYTQIIFFAFVRRIQKEKKQQVTKYKLLENVDLEQLLAHTDGNEEIANQIVELVRKQADSIDPEKRTMPVKRGRKKVKEVPELLDNLE